jgi:imidazolonepropionase-like amidohydrolase
VTTVIPPVSAAIGWIPCRGWFSAQPHDNPAWLGVANGRIAQVAGSPPSQGSRVLLDDQALFALPLLADTHVHVYLDAWPVAPAQRATPGSKDFETEVEDAIGRVDQALPCGVGLLRDMGDPYGINREVKRRLAQRGTAAPELIICGTGFHRPKKYGRFLGVCRESVAEICASIDELERQGDIDFIKLVTTGIVDFPERRVKQAPQFSVEELSAVVAHAHALGHKVASHCSGQQGIDINLAAGVDFLEHGYFIREDQIDRMIQARTAWTPTLSPVHVQGEHEECCWPQAVRGNIEMILEEHAARIEYGVSRGATVLAGTDSGSPGVEMGRGIQLELQRLATAKIPAERLLHMATIGNAQALDARSYSPTLEAGAPASFALYEHCPWRDIRNLDSLRHVFWFGQRIR